MMHLLAIEWLKLKKYRTFWVLMILFASLYLLWNYGVNKSFVSIGNGPVNVFSSSYSFPAVWGNMGFVYSWLELFLSILVIIVICNEFTFKTNRQHVIDGMHRLEFLHGKVYLILGISAISTLFFILAGLIFGYANGGGNPLDNIEKVAYVFIYTLNYTAFAGLLAILFKRSGITMVMLFAYFLIESILGKLINYKLNTHFGDLLPLQSSDELLPLPVLKSMNGLVPSSTPEISTYVYVIASLVYVAIYYIIARQKMLKSDL
jgi:ABC-2 type transport system permease protein